MAYIRTFMIATTLFLSASLLCMDQNLTLGQQKIVRIKAKQKSYFKNCETLGMHKGGKPLLKALGYSCLFNAMFDLKAAYMFPETAPQMIAGAALNALGALIMYTSSGALERKKDAAEKDIATLLKDLDALLAQDRTITEQQRAIGTFHTGIGEQRAKSNAYLGGAIICAGNIAKNLVIARSVADILKTDQYLDVYLTAERLTYYVFGLLALGYSRSEKMQEDAILQKKRSATATLTTLVEKLAQPMH